MILRHKVKGFTLIEIIVSIALLGIIAASFLSMFSRGYSSVFSMGNRTKALKEAETLIDVATNAKNVSAIDTMCIEINTSIGDLLKPALGNESRYFHELSKRNGKDYELLTVAVFYQNGKRYITLTSLIPSGGI